MLENRLEQAQSKEDRALAASLRKIPEWNGLTVSYRRVSAGFTNFNYLIHVKELDLTGFAKVVGPNTEAFIDRKAAHEAAVLAAQCGVGAGLIGYVEEDDFEVYEFLSDYRCFTIADMLDPDLSAKVMEAYATIHTCPPLPQTNTGFQQIESLQAQLASANADRPEDLDDLLWQARRAQAAITRSGAISAPCYNDGYVTNYMKNDQGDVRIIDWEYGANNDPYWDLATYFFESFADRETRQELLRIYKQDAGEREDARVDIYLPLVCLKWGLWASLQSSISAIDFDYLKYADILFMRARHLMRQVSWDAALETV